MKLRPYQQDSVTATYEHLRTRDDSPCIVIPTGGGKTPVIATICRDAVQQWSGRVIVLAHVKELLQQSVDKLLTMAPELQLKAGVYSAGLGRKDLHHPIIVAGIQSVYKRACDIGSVDLVLVDEAHMIPPEGDGMYQTFLADARKINPHLRVIGLTATPYRLKHGMICGPENILNHVCYEIGIRALIEQGFLCPLRSKAGHERPDFEGLHTRAGEFVQSEIEATMGTDKLVEAACQDIVDETRERRSVLVFAAGVAHAQMLAARLEEMTGETVATVFGDTQSGKRAAVIEMFQAGKLKYLVNVNVLTTGFDAPNVDCVALVRPTLSPGLYYQMVGRGFRLHPAKADTLVLDFGGNIMRHGPVDQIRVASPRRNGEEGGDAPAKICPGRDGECRAMLAPAVRMCPECGHEFPPPEKKHDTRATTQGILSGQVSHETLRVEQVLYSHHRSIKDKSKPATMKVMYKIHAARYEMEWVCFDHDGWARMKAESWWKKRSATPPPACVDDAVDLANQGALCDTTHITVRHMSGVKWPTIIGYELGEVPAPITLKEQEEYVPF